MTGSLLQPRSFHTFRLTKLDPVATVVAAVCTTRVLSFAVRNTPNDPTKIQKDVVYPFHGAESDPFAGLCHPPDLLAVCKGDRPNED